MLLRQQLLLFGKAARATAESPLRYLTFVGDSLRPLADYFIRRPGCPRNEWTRMVLNEALRLTGSMDTLVGLVGDQHIWQSFIQRSL